MPTIAEVDGCTGCSACVVSCPQQCISMSPGSDGFLYPRIDPVECTNCSVCYDVCPAQGLTAYPGESPSAFAAWSLDRDTRYMSTSGGVFSELARGVLAMGGRVVGARYDGPDQVCHDMIESQDRLVPLRQSKYVQSDKRDVLRRVVDTLDDDRPLLFVGSPCECAGLARVIPAGAENLFMCDFICRGACSPMAYRSYLSYLEQANASRAVQVWFKNKSISWNRFATRVTFESGRVYLADRYHDLYMRGYLEANLFMRESCGSCAFKGGSRESDLTLGDFWGVEAVLPSVDRTEGVSLVLANTEKGLQLLNAVRGSIECIPVELDLAIAGNPAYSQSVTRNLDSAQFLATISAGTRFDEALRPYLIGPVRSWVGRMVAGMKKFARSVLRRR